MAVWERVHAAFMATMRNLRHSDRGVTSVEYGVMLLLFGTGLIAGASFLYTAATNNYASNEVAIGDPQTVCVGDEIVDPSSGLCVQNPMRISAVTPSFGPVAGGTAVTISGASFATGATVTFDGVPATSVTVLSGETTITAVTPAGTIGYADVVVTNPANATPARLASLSATGYGKFIYATLPGAPDAPTGVPGSTSVSVSWSPPTDTGGMAITEYTVERSVNGTNWTNPLVTTETTLNVTGLTNGVGYYFRVAASNDVGYGPFSPASSLLTPQTGPPSPPAAPTGVPGNTQIVVNWTAPNDGGSPITDYQLQRATSSTGPWTTVPDGVGTGTSVTVTGLTNGTTYYFQVRALNSQGWSEYSPPSAGLIPLVAVTRPGAPTGVTGTRTGNGEMTVNWTAPASNGGQAITGYTLEYESDGITSTSTCNAASGNYTNASDSALANETSEVTTGLFSDWYCVRVFATNGVTTGSPNYGYSSPVSMSVSAPSVPRNVTATPGDASVTVAWQAPTDDGGAATITYRVQRSQRDSTTWSTGQGNSEYTTTSLSQVFASLTNGSDYRFRVRAEASTTLVSAWVEVGPVTPTALTAPSEPRNMSATRETRFFGALWRANLSWNAPASDGGSDITSYTVESVAASAGACPVAGWQILASVTGTTYSTAWAWGFSSSAQCYRVTATNGVGTGAASTAAGPVGP